MKRELTSQELLERYISSVKMGLPPEQGRRYRGGNPLQSAVSAGRSGH